MVNRSKPAKVAMILTVIAIFSGGMAAVYPHGAPVFGDEGEMAICKKMHELSNAGDYGAIYDLMDRSYAEHLDRESFTSVSKRLAWRAGKFSFGSVETYGDFEYMPIRVEVTVPHQPTRVIDSVLFLRRTGGGLRLMNFPLVNPEIPDFSVEPVLFGSERHGG